MILDMTFNFADGKDEQLHEAFIKKLPTNSVGDSEGNGIGDIVKKRDPEQIVLYRWVFYHEGKCGFYMITNKSIVSVTTP